MRKSETLQKLQEAYAKGGFRERYAMNFGKRGNVIVRGHRCWKFTYPESDPYQDANGAVYDAESRQWID